MRRNVLLGGALLAGMIVIVNGTLAEADRGGNDRGGERQVIRLVERIADEPTFDDGGAPGPGVGDRLIFSADLFDPQGHEVGRDGADCVVVRIDRSRPAPSDQQIVECMVTVELPDGQITFQGLAQGTENRFAVTGGTGSYRRARGEAHVKDRVFLEEADVTITLVR